MNQANFVLACSKCGQRIVLENGMKYDDLIKKFNIIVSDNKEIMIMCGECNNRIKF